MNFLKWLLSLLSKLFGKRQPRKSQPPGEPDLQHVVTTMRITPQQMRNAAAKREQERNERISNAEAELKDWIISKIKARGDISFSWESGSDEAFVTFKDFSEPEENNYMDLETYLIDKLDIPDAGEFEMHGSGAIYIADNLVRAKYSSTMRGIIDYDEDTDETVYSEEEKDSGDKALFPV